MEGAIFDMDGVLVDNVSYHIRSWKRLGERLGKELTEEEIKSVFGRRNREMLAALFDRPFSEEEARKHADYKEEVYRRLIAPELEPLEGLVDFLSDLRSEKFQIALATSGPPKNVEFVLGRLGLDVYFDEVVTGVEVTNGKPDPEIFLKAVDKLNLTPRRCVVFEDSPAGLESARRAGCPYVAVATTHPAEELRAHDPALIISDFSQLQAEHLLNLTPRSGTDAPPQ